MLTLVPYADHFQVSLERKVRSRMSFAVTREKKYQNATELESCAMLLQGEMRRCRHHHCGDHFRLVSRHVLGKRASLTLDRYLANERMIRCPGEM